MSNAAAINEARNTLYSLRANIVNETADERESTLARCSDLQEDIKLLEAEDLREQAARHEQDAAESFERCDTDGFVSQWASGLNAQLKRAQAELLEGDGRKEYDALFDLKTGELVAAKLVDGRFGLVRGILENDDPRSEAIRWVNYSMATTEKRERAHYAKHGLRIGSVRAVSGAKIKGYGTGLAGAASCYVGFYRKDGGFSRDVIVTDDGSGE